MKKAFIIHENEDWIEPLRVNLHDLHVPLPLMVNFVNSIRNL